MSEREALYELHRFRMTDDAWVGRSEPSPDFHDLAIERVDMFEEFPPLETLQRIVASVVAAPGMKLDAVAAICAARQAKLNWRAGPAADKWSIVEARIDGSGAFWMTLHEYETDEYSYWPVRFDAAGKPELVLRAASAGGPRSSASMVWER